MNNLINSEIEDFKMDAFHDGQFKTFGKEDAKGKWTVLFFYPADFTFVCPTELKDMADHYPELQKINVEVFSVSTDTHFVHKAWHDSSDTIKHIQYPMLSDKGGRLSRSLGIYDEQTGLALRGTFLINPDGLIKLSEVNDDGIGRNAAELLRKIKAAQFVHSHPGEVCPAKWAPGGLTLKPGLDLVEKI